MNSNLHTIDTSTGAATNVDSGIGGSFASSGDLSYVGDNSFFATSSTRCGGYGDCLWKINATTGSGTQIGSTGYYAVGDLDDRPLQSKWKTRPPISPTGDLHPRGGQSWRTPCCNGNAGNPSGG